MTTRKSRFVIMVITVDTGVELAWFIRRSDAYDWVCANGWQHIVREYWMGE